MSRYICIHGHFYQPPRENPWLEAIELQESAQPYHDWNQRISAECYATNSLARILDGTGYIDKIINNYSRISFNFGPTLLSWLEDGDPETYARILEADRLSRDRFSGHGSAMAQGYNHAILPLCNRRDKHTQVLWGIRDFMRRFDRLPEGMWLPETAVDLQTLDVLAQQGIRFVVLAPHQAKNVRGYGESEWQSVANCGVDTGMAYEVELPGGQNIAVFFYDGAISNAVGFQKLLSDGHNFLNRLMGAFSPESDRPQLVHVAVDGETFGHHHQFGEMALAYLIDKIESGGDVRLTNYGEYLEKNPPSRYVEIVDGSSWSCCHGIERWREDCGCSSGANPGWRQKWRTPLRSALDELRDRLEPLYASEMKNLLRDPWAARDGYIDLILDRGQETVERFFAAYAVRPLDRKDRVRALELLEMQRFALLMYTSCGWFFDDITGIETLQILQYAGRAIQLADSSGSDIEASFLETLSEAESNQSEKGNGRDLYLKFVKPAIIDDIGIAAHYAMRSLVYDFPARADFYSRIIDRGDLRVINHNNAKLIVGNCTIISGITGEFADVDFAAIYPWNTRACVRLKTPEQSGNARQSLKYRDCEAVIQGKMAEMIAAFEKEEDMLKVFRLMDECYGDACFALKDLIKDEQLKFFECLIASATASLNAQTRHIFARIAPLMESMLNLGMTPPPRFLIVDNERFHSQLLNECMRRPVRPGNVLSLLETAKRRNIQWRQDALEPEIRAIIESLALQVCRSPTDVTARRNLTAALIATKYLPFTVDLHNAQNHCYALLRSQYPEIMAAVGTGNAEAESLYAEFQALGEMLSIKLR